MVFRTENCESKLWPWILRGSFCERHGNCTSRGTKVNLCLNDKLTYISHLNHEFDQRMNLALPGLALANQFYTALKVIICFRHLSCMIIMIIVIRSNRRLRVAEDVELRVLCSRLSGWTVWTSRRKPQNANNRIFNMQRFIGMIIIVSLHVITWACFERSLPGCCL